MIDKGIEHRAVGGHGGCYLLLDALLVTGRIDLVHGGLPTNLTVMMCRDAVEMRDGRGGHLIGEL